MTNYKIHTNNFFAFAFAHSHTHKQTFDMIFRLRFKCAMWMCVHLRMNVFVAGFQTSIRPRSNTPLDSAFLLQQWLSVLHDIDHNSHNLFYAVSSRNCDFFPSFASFTFSSFASSSSSLSSSLSCMSSVAVRLLLSFLFCTDQQENHHGLIAKPNNSPV